MVESNQTMPDLQMILARRAKNLEGSRCIVTFLSCMNDIVNQLERLSVIKCRTANEANEWLKKHPIMILLAYKLKGMILTDPDIGYIKAKAQVEDMANL